jgi:dTDP-4-amino-4,6-dideoxygalactose transaminase
MLRIGEEEIRAVARVIRSRALFRYGDPKSGHPNECAKFERELADMVEKRHAVLVTSGTAALICGLAGLEVGPGDEVIVPGYTFIATALAPLAVGAIPVIAEIDESLTLDPKDVEAKITKRTKAILPVHMSGLPADMRAIMRLARRRGIKVLEDACQADGGSYRGKRLGAIGDVGAYSFNYFKNVTCGEGGALVTDDARVHGRALIHHDGGLGFWPHGKDIPVPIFAGWNFRASEIQGAILRVQLRRIDGLLRRTRAHKRRFVEMLSDHPKLRLIKHNDLAGECGTVAGLLFEQEKPARLFMARLAEQGVWSWTPIDSGRHVYSNWEALMERRGSYHPALDAFRRPENRGSKMKYSPDMCPRTLDILARTVFISLHPDLKASQVRAWVRACEKAAEAI